MTKISERGIVMTGESVRGIRELQKTETRRVAKPQPPPCLLNEAMIAHDPASPSGFSYISDEYDDFLLKCPWGKVGDRLYVKEVWSPGCQQDLVDQDLRGIVYQADYTEPSPLGWKSNRFMFKWASRMYLTITDIHPEHLQDISWEEVWNEGVRSAAFHNLPLHLPLILEDSVRRYLISAFASYWDSLRKSPYLWDNDPVVWAIKFYLSSIYVNGEWHDKSDNQEPLGWFSRSPGQVYPGSSG